MITDVDLSQAKKDGERMGMRDMADRIIRMIDDNKADTGDIHYFCKMFLKATNEMVN